MTFAELRTRPGDAFAAELRQTSTLLVTHAASAQITQLLQGDDEVFLKQTFPRAGTLAAPGWANLWDLLPETAATATANAAGPAGKFAPPRATVELAATATATTAPAGNTVPSSSPVLSRLFLNA